MRMEEVKRCGLCNNFQRNQRQFRFTFDCSQAELVRSANDGCVQCWLLLAGSRHFEPELGELKDLDRMYIWGDNVDGGGSVEMEIFSDGALKLRLEFFVTKGKSSPLKGARMLPTIPGDTRAPVSMDWAKRQLQECIDSHKSCGGRIVPKLPSRVLEIRPEREGRLSVRLFHAKGAEAPYACLSHRWSKPAVLETKRSNLTSHENGIEWDLLPKTFKDAILVAHDLGIRYIWIDSLCIVQDDVDDKWPELAKMSSIYANSRITIAATQSDGKGRGCYSEVSLHHQDHRLLAKQPDATMVATDLYVREKIAHIGEQGAVTPLLKRGWVCQERLLSPRILQFCEKELVWECQESSTCQCSCYSPTIRLKEKYSELFRHNRSTEHRTEIIATSDVNISNEARAVTEAASSEKASDTEGVDNEKPSSRWLSNFGHERHHLHRADSLYDHTYSAYHYTLQCAHDSEVEDKSMLEPCDDIIWGWRHVINDYSGMDLTEQSDRLPAIAGVASQIGELLHARYLAGLWQTHLPSDLLWRTDHLLECEQHRSQYRAPSWSWASIDWKVKYYRRISLDREFSVVRALCDPVTNVNPFGEVTHGFLEVNAKTANLAFELDLSEDKTQSRRRLKVEFLGDSAIFVPDYDISVGAAAKHALALDSQVVKYNFLCIGDFDIKRDDAALSETRSGGSLAASLVFQLVDGGRYERVGVLERTRGRYRKSSQPWIRSWRERERFKSYTDEGWESRTGLMLI